MYRLKFAGVDAPSFLKVTGVNMSVTPKITHYNQELLGNYGNLDGGADFGEKVFEVSYMIIYDNEHDTSYYVDEITKWLKIVEGGTYPLVLDTTNEYYMSRVSDVSELEDSIVYGSGTITFTACNPRRYSPSGSEAVLSVDGTTTAVEYTGIAPAFPYFTIVGGEGTTAIKITNTLKGEYLLIQGDNLNGTIVIDIKNKWIKMGGKWRMDLLNINSDWIKLYRGTNNFKIEVEGTAITSAKFTYTVAY